RRHTRFSRDWSSDVCSSDLDHSNLVAWATALEDGAPLAGVELSLHGSNVTATTGPDGTATLELPSSPAALLIGRLGDDSAILPRSEERRVGKESRSRLAA